MPDPFEPTVARNAGTYQARSVWSPLLAVAATVAILALGLAVGMLVYLIAVEPGVPVSGWAPKYMLAFLLCVQASWIGFTWLAAGAFNGRPVETLNLVKPVQGWIVVPLALLGLIAVLGVFEGIVMITGAGDSSADMKAILPLFRSDQWWLAALMAGVGAPLSEEFLFRGFLFSALARSRYLGVLAASLITTAGWTAIHGYSGIGTLEVALMGLYFSWLLWRTGSLWVTIICHGVYNTAIALIMTFGELPAGAT